MNPSPRTERSYRALLAVPGLPRILVSVQLSRIAETQRVPPKYLVPQLWRALLALLTQWSARGRNSTVRKEMNVAYFLGYLSGWAFGANAKAGS